MRHTLLAIALAAGTAAICSAQHEGSFDRSLSVSGPVELDIVTDSGGITVTPGSAGSVHVHAVLKAQHNWFESGDVEQRIRELERNPPIEQNGNRIRIGYVHSRDLLKGISMRLEIQTPRETQVRARADSGGIRVEGIRGPADCHTDSGGIDVRDVGSEVRAAADSGGIRIENIKGPAYARADSGGIEANGISGSIDAEADSGGIHVEQSSAAPIRAKADSGGVTIRLASNAGYDVNVEAESGHISVRDVTVNGDISKHHIEGKVRGGGPPVNVKVDSGDVSVD
jgi:Putative adhesin